MAAQAQFVPFFSGSAYGLWQMLPPEPCDPKSTDLLANARAAVRMREFSTWERQWLKRLDHQCNFDGRLANWQTEDWELEGDAFDAEWLTLRLLSRGGADLVSRVVAAAERDHHSPINVAKMAIKMRFVSDATPDRWRIPPEHPLMQT